jgi:hypothetical protein
LKARSCSALGNSLDNQQLSCSIFNPREQQPSIAVRFLVAVYPAAAGEKGRANVALAMPLLRPFNAGKQ